MVEFRLLGPLEAVEGDRQVALGGLKQTALLAVLLLRRNEVVSSDRLIDALWGDSPPSTAAAIVRVYVSNLRKVLGAETLLTRGGGYVLLVEPGQLDTTRFDALVADGRAALGTGEASRAQKLFSTALAIWRGDPLANLSYEPFVETEITRLEEARLSALEDRVEADLMLGRHRELVPELEELIERHPHRDRLLGFQMLALYRCGRQVDALESYRRGRAALAETLGLEPTPALRSLELKILNHDPELGAAPVSTARSIERFRNARRGRVLFAVGGGFLLVAATTAGIAEMGGGKSLVAAANTLAAINTHSDRIESVVGVGAGPGAVTFGSGSLWVANVDDQTVSRVDPVTLRTVRTISFDEPPVGIASTDTAVWVVASNPSAPTVPVSRIDPLFDTVEHVTDVGNVALGAPPAVAAQGGDLWVAPLAGDVTQLDPATGAVERHIDPNAGPVGLAIGAGAVWVTDNQADTVTRVDPTGLVTPVPVGHGPGAIAVGDGGVWVADNGDNAVVRINPDTSAVTATIPVGAAPTGIAVGGGSVWVANSGDGTVTRIDAATLKPTTITVGGSPQDVTIAGSRAWVTVDRPVIPSAPAPLGGTLRLDAAYDVDFMDPALAYGPLSWQLLYATCANLVNYPDRSGPGGAEVVPEVAQSLPTRSSDGLTYTFTIRPGFRFSPPSDEPVTAETFKYSIERTLNPRMRSPVDNEFLDVVGARAYMAGRTSSISGITVRGNVLSIRLTEPIPDLPVRLAQPFFCAVPLDTPLDPNGVHVIPSAGPYQVASYTPGQGVVLTLNPNYRGGRPHHFARIELHVNIPPSRAIADIENGRADYAVDGEVASGDVATLAARYGPGSPAARTGHEQYFVDPFPQVDFLALNTHRPLFASLRMRQAVNYAIDRSALAQLGGGNGTLPDRPTDDYLPPGIPGYTNLHVYPLTPDLAAARSLVQGQTPATAVLYTCDQPPCGQQAQIVTTDLAAIGIQVQVKVFPYQTLYSKIASPGEPFDLAFEAWGADYLDPDDFLNLVLESGTFLPPFNDHVLSPELVAASRLTGATRYLTYARLDGDLLRNGAPWVAFGNASSHELFGADIGCQLSGRYGTDVAALCLRSGTG